MMSVQPEEMGVSKNRLYSQDSIMDILGLNNKDIQWLKDNGTLSFEFPLGSGRIVIDGGSLHSALWQGKHQEKTLLLRLAAATVGFLQVSDPRADGYKEARDKVRCILTEAGYDCP